MSTLAVALVGPLELPFADRTEEEHPPTIEVPDEIHTHFRKLHLHVQEIRLFDRVTGHVFSAFSEDDFRRTHPLRVEVFGRPFYSYLDSKKWDGFISTSSDRWERLLAGKDEVRLVFLDQDECSKARLVVNEKPFTQQCETFKEGIYTRYQITVRSDQIADK